ncbi:MAG: hypothetical protein RLZZ599_886 [Bacteroidota bacterium]|jgi:glycosyltransferase involved in cell wall biosynthesis
MNPIPIQNYLQAVCSVQDPMVSLVVPLFNVRQDLDLFLDQAQKFETLIPYEIIFVDNNSPSGEGAYLSGLGANVVFESRQGVNFARQKGMELARAEVIISIDVDTVFPPNFIDKIALPLLMDREISLVYTTTIGCNDPWNPTLWEWGKGQVKCLLHRMFARQNVFAVRQTRALAMAFRKYAEVRYPADLANFKGGDDGLLSVQLMALGRAVRLKQLVYTRNDANSKVKLVKTWPQYATSAQE